MLYHLVVFSCLLVEELHFCCEDEGMTFRIYGKIYILEQQQFLGKSSINAF